MHWLGCNDVVAWLNKVKTQIFWPTANFENFEINLYFIYLPAVRPDCTRCSAPEISHNKGYIMVADLRKCCSEDDLPTAPWQFLLFLILLPCSLLNFGVNLIFKGDDNLLQLLLIISCKKLASTWYNYSGMMFLHVLENIL